MVSTSTSTSTADAPDRVVRVRGHSIRLVPLLVTTYRSHPPANKMLIEANHFPCLKATSRLGVESYAFNPSTLEGRPVDLYVSA